MNGAVLPSLLLRRDTSAGRIAVSAARARAYSLIEMIGVLAIIALLAAALVPVAIKSMDRATWSRENASLGAMADALKQYIVDSKSIPDQDGWVQAIGSQLSLATNDIALTPRNWTRVYLIEPGGWLETALTSGPWRQNAGGISLAPTNARVLLLSTLARDLPLSSGKPSAADFNAIWDTPQGAQPTGTSYANWPNGADLVIQRINLQPLFHRVLLVNGAGGQGYFSIDGNAPPAAVPPGGSGTNTFYIEGTVLHLYTNSLSTDLVVNEIVHSDMSRVFEYGVWRDQISMGVTNIPASTPTILGGLAGQFVTNSFPSGIKWGSTPQTTMTFVMGFMDTYTAWANNTPRCFNDGAAIGVIMDDLNKLEDASIVP